MLDNDDPMVSPSIIDFEGLIDQKNKRNRTPSKELAKALYCINGRAQFTDQYGFSYAHQLRVETDVLGGYMQKGNRSPRLYLPRLFLTERFNAQKVTEEETENYVFMDYCIMPEQRKDITNFNLPFNEDEINLGLKLKKAPPPVVGEVIHFERRNVHVDDSKSIKRFVGRVYEVHEGTCTEVVDKEKREPKLKICQTNANFGLILVHVESTDNGYGRSLVLPPFIPAKVPKVMAHF